MGAQGDRGRRSSSRSRGRSTGGRWGRSRSRASREAGAVRAARARRAVRDARDARRPRSGREHRGDLPRARAGRRRRLPAPGRDARGGARARGRVRGDAGLRRGAERHRADRRVLRLAAARRAAGRGHARQGARKRAADRGAARRRRRADRRSCPATTPRPSAATRSPARPPARSSTRSTTSCSRTSARSASGFEAQLLGTSAAPGCCSRSSSAGPRGPVVDAALEHNLLVGTAGETALRLTPPLTISDRARPTSAIDLLREMLAMTHEVRAAGSDPAAGRGAAHRDAGRARRGAASEGIDAVQTTVSRDIAQLGLVKVRNGDGRLVYALPAPPTCAGSSSSPSALRSWAIAMIPTGNLLVDPHAARLRGRARRRDRRGRPPGGRRHGRRRQHDLRRRARRLRARRARRRVPHT